MTSACHKSYSLQSKQGPEVDNLETEKWPPVGLQSSKLYPKLAGGKLSGEQKGASLILNPRANLRFRPGNGHCQRNLPAPRLRNQLLHVLVLFVRSLVRLMVRLLGQSVAGGVAIATEFLCTNQVEGAATLASGEGLARGELLDCRLVIAACARRVDPPVASAT